MRLVCISDTHNLHKQLELPNGDVLIHCGDACLRGTMEEFAAFCNWLAQQPHRYKLFVPGNHDFCVERDAALCRNLLTRAGARLLIDQAVTIEGIKFYGTPWVPNLSGWAFYASSQRLRDRFADIPTDTDVLITHGPPSGELDLIPGVFTVGEPHGLEEDEWSDEGGLHVGSMALLQRVKQLKQLKLHVFGHIHESAGSRNGSINAAICDRNYKATNSPVVVEV
jgi:Icc-related predicted phosphoesterase